MSCRPPNADHALTRRDVLQLLGAGAGAAALGACMEPPGDPALPFVRRPPEHAPGTSTLYATTMVLDGYAAGLLVESQDGRPIKVDGNPEHPASMGASTAQQQASVLDLYDPQRARTVEQAGLPLPWERLEAQLRQLPPGELWLVMPPQSSPVIAELLARIGERHRNVRVVYHSGLDHTAAYRGAELALGEPAEVLADLSRSDVVVALDDDFLNQGPMSLRRSVDFAARRRMRTPDDPASRLWVAEPMPTPTGSLADVRLALPAGEVTALALGLVAELGRRGRPVPALPQALHNLALRRLEPRGEDAVAWVRGAADDLVRAGPGAAVLVGSRQPAACHALGHWLRAATGALGRTVTHATPALLEPTGGATLADLVGSIGAGRVGAVLILDADPVDTAPAELELAEALAAVPLTVHLSLRASATSEACDWLAPLSHYLETWGDGRAADGTVSFQQPLIKPLYDTRSLVEVLALLAGLPPAADPVRDLWRARLGRGFDADWTEALRRGLLPGSAAPRSARLPRPATGLAAQLERLLAPVAAGGLELALAPSPALGDGRFAANPWLQELPHPFTKLTWGNAAYMSRATARRLGVDDGRVVRLGGGGRLIELPAVVVPGHADDSISVDIGHGRRGSRVPVADGVGVSVQPLLPLDGSAIAGPVRAENAGRDVGLARTQEHRDPAGRDIARHLDLAEWRRQPVIDPTLHEPLPTLIGERTRTGLQWAMTIDTSICTGCSACVIACQAENNVPVVGPDGVADGREMHWIRIDTYVDGPEHDPEIVHQPMLCQHCETAPCEYVCPVYATVHSPDGLNEMVYNRCIGTRFCSNNCPYKVRRFNWFEYNATKDARTLQRNPDVTVRSRGVMEKCTYCVQRIRGAEIRASVEKRAIGVGEVVTACQQACPTRAIQFGALQHEDSNMARWRVEGRAYGVLRHLGTRPRTLYLAKVRNRP